MTFGIGLQQTASILQRPMLADAGDDVLQRPALWRVIEHVVHSNQRNERGIGNILEFCQPATIIAAIKQAGRKPHGPARCFLETAKHPDHCFGVDPRRRHDDEIEPFHLLQQIRQTQDAIAFLRAILADRQQMSEADPRRRDPADKPECRASRR